MGQVGLTTDGPEDGAPGPHHHSQRVAVTVMSDRSTKPELIPIRQKAIRMLENGDATLVEISNVSGVSRQLIRYWARNIDWQQARYKKLTHIWKVTK